MDITHDRSALDAALALVNRARTLIDDGDEDAARVALAQARYALTGERAPDGARVALENELEVRLGHPAHSLVTYGTLAPGRENHHVMNGVGGEWSAVTIEGEIGEWEGYPIFRWSPGGQEIPAALVRSFALPDHYPQLDRFEGDAYARHLVSYASATGFGVANCYVAAPLRGR